MSLLFLDPGLLALLVLLAVFCLLVWAGRFPGWFGRDELWTLAVWPLPAVVLLLPLVGAPLWALVRFSGLVDAEGGMLAGVAYLTIFGAAGIALTVWPPAWLLPAWARQRVVAAPQARAAPRSDAVPALHVVGGRGHGSLARWAWRVDAVPGFLWQDGPVLRFRALGEVAAGQVRTWLDDALEEIAPGTPSQERHEDGVDPQADPQEVRLDAPHGGWWTRRSADVEVVAIAAWRVRATRPWRRAGLLELDVAGRGTLRLWVTEVAWARRVLGAT